ncbi:hypothetical protein SDRG_13969 [Saprolegnia diclina VS20]|uniref:Uncharacterized protein n=1 Tax=Saprolegnia diclina (strain VS20) TaxID=1156394 RepID=T0R885_SAPDV|nr:hypothetical protein SDRG_13969 [Saprolegnia diclina VS20]EQC28288.1 hypothetical protein SDRG_13969 [Saprolegnia diclina VS20]|eukprot:XP_008618292.1 hypothetical protein SDRG_13969 [Saprolegnia diclina VS20]
MAQPTQYCWVDFNKAFELAHTAARQQRCLAQYDANGAVYLESVLRNTDRHAFAAAYHTPGSNYEIAILRGLEGTVAGVEWLDAIASVATSVDEEVAYWQRHGIGAFRYQWHNLFLPGLVETVTLRNVFGLETSVILKSTVESQGPWTTVVFSPPFVLDLLFAGHCNASLIRGTPDDILNTWCDGQSPRPFESFIGLSPYERHIGVVRDTLGPFLAIDLYIVPVLSPVGALATDLISAFHDTLNASSAALYSALDGALVVTPVPPAWPSNLLVYGGSPFCTYLEPQTYVQAPFTSTDDCTRSSQWTVRIPRRSLVLALALVNDSIDVICAQQSLTSTICAKTLLAAKELAPRGHRDSTLLQNATAAVAALNISVMQFASDVSQANYSLLLQPLLQPPFAFYGWILLLDWIAGIREVISLQGDNGTLVLISDAYDTTSTTPTSAVIGSSTLGLYYLVAYSVVALGAVALATLVVSTVSHHDVTGTNFFVFNRVAGSTWLGRPLLLLRGGSAILLLSSAPISLTQPYGVFVQLALPRHSIWETSIMAWEATWVSYVLHEVVLPLRYQNACFLAILGTALAWLCTVIIDVAWPLTVTTSVDRECSIAEAYYTMLCASAVVQTGHRQRLLLLSAVQCLGLPCLWLFNWAKCKNRQSPSLKDARLPFVGQVFLASRHDAAAQLASGLIPLGPWLFLDLKLWRLLITSPSVAIIGPFEPHAAVYRDNRWVPRVWVVVGTMYVAAAIYSSVSYLGLAQGLLTNDLVWPAFNMTGSHSFLANWFNEPAHVLGADSSAIALTNHQQINALGLFNLTQP